MTQRYAHLAPENLREAIRVLDQDDHNFITVKISIADRIYPWSNDPTSASWEEINCYTPDPR